ncbi:unnamed protein product [Schistocephalus solidus]|uniref:Reverse transcriptase domain-containing protein n=1 Tax=Schistocephalus solidus TaxID=70667 RepID=A0A183TPJ8_SCHSO|nr:unnamed protein product [Schistocephalus solidus]
MVQTKFSFDERSFGHYRQDFGVGERLRKEATLTIRPQPFPYLVTSLRNEQQSVVVIYVDQSKAFDKVPNRRLLVKLEAVGIQPPLLDFIGSYFSNRSQKVLVALPTLDKLDTFLQICNPDDILQVLLMIEVGSDGFVSLVMDYAVSNVTSR